MRELRYNHHYVPIRGFLRKNLGRKWDDVYSDFCRKIDRRCDTDYMILNDFKREVSTRTFLQDGKILEQTKYCYGPNQVDGFYVHPETGILEYKSLRLSKRQVKDKWRQKEFIPVPNREGWFYKNFNGLWFRCYEEKSSYSSSYTWTQFVIEQRKKDWKVGRKLESCNSKEVEYIKAEYARRQEVSGTARMAG
jgi:hypothetical protein